MGVAVLGQLQVEGHPSGLSPRDRVVLAALAVYARRPVSTDSLADALWGEALPASWAKVVYGCIWRLRKVLGAPAIDTVPSGYRLSLADDELDHRVFERLLERGREALVEDDPARALFLVEEALGLWRGPALAELEEWEPGRVEAARLEGLRMDAEELRIEAKIRTGQAAAVLEHARALIAQAPLRERRWALLATALYRSGRQGEALATLQRARVMLVGQLGLDPGPELVDLERRLLNQDPSLTDDGATGSSPDCPYRGLLPYDAEDADVFFGREDDVAACMRRLRDTGVLVVIGPSGVGKSSLVRAGLVASLTRAGTPALVGRPGAHPLESLAMLKPRGRQTLVVDQTEEAVTLCGDPEERERFFTALATHVGAGGGLVLTLRADHLGDLAPYPEIARILEDGLYLLGPMREPDLRRAIEAPAQGAGLRLEPGLVDLVVREAVGQPAGLPMLSHVLRETWERREGSTLTVQGYRATGGIQQAVSHSAEILYDGMDDTQRAQLRSLLLRLVVPSEAGDPVRMRVPRDKVAVDEAHARLVEQLIDARLVSIDGEAVQIAHEALVRVWPRLRRWLDDDVEGQRLFRHLTEAADAWEVMGRPASELYRGARLSRVLDWRERTGADLSDTESAFLEASADLSTSELRGAQLRVRRERRTNRRLRGALAAVAVLAVCALVAGVFAVVTAERAAQDRDRAQAASDLAFARQAGAVALDHWDPAVSVLLAVSALTVEDSVRARDTLVDVLLRWPSLLSQRGAEPTIHVDLKASQDGSLLAASRPGEGQGLLLMEADTFEPLPFADDIPASGIDFSPDSSLLAMAVNQWTGNVGDPSRIDPQPIRLYDMPEGTRAERQPGGFPEGASVEYDLDFSADGRRLVAAVDRYDAAGRIVLDTTAFVWEVADPAKPVLRVGGLGESPVLKLSRDGRRLYAVATTTDLDRPVRVYDVDSGRLLESLDLATAAAIEPGSGALSPDGRLLAFGVGSEVVAVDTSTWELRAAGLRADAGATVWGLEFSHDGTLLAAATDNAHLIWETASRDLVHRIEVGGGHLGSFDFSADDRTLLIGSDYVSAWDLTGERGPFSVGKATDPAEYDVAMPAPDGRTLVRSRAGRMWFVDNETGRRTEAVRVEPSDDYHVWSPDSTRLLSWRDAGLLRLWDTNSGRPLARTELDRGAIATFSATGREVYVNDLQERLLVLDAATLKPVRSPIRLGEQVLAVVPHPDGSVLAFSHSGAVLRVDPDSGDVEREADAGTFPRARVSVADPSHDGRRVLAMNLSAEDAEVQLVDTTTWKRVGTSAPWNEELGTFDLSPDGTQFASVDDDAITVVGAGTGRRATIPLPAPAPAVRIAYLPDSSRLLVAGIEGSTWTVDARWQSWVTRACDIAGRNLSQHEWHENYPHRAYEATCPQWPPGP